MLLHQIIKSRGFFLIALGALSFTAISNAAAEEKPHLTRTTLLEHNVTLPSNAINGKVIRVSFPAGFKTPRHIHDGPGPRYVVKGTLQVVEGEKTGIYSEGEVFWESGQSMTVENVGGEPAEMIIFELVPGSSKK